MTPEQIQVRGATADEVVAVLAALAAAEAAHAPSRYATWREGRIRALRRPHLANATQPQR
jgi:hypothetical protein